MGDSGTGKTELIDILVNFLLGVEICDKFRYSITEGADHISKRQHRLNEVSRGLGNITKEVIVYHIPAEFISQDRLSSTVPTCINLIDTPGYGSNAMHQGDRMTSQVLEEFIKSLDQLDNIFLCLKSSENRVDRKIKELFMRLN